MIRGFREQVGIAGLVVAVVALVVALGGGAYAASGALTGKQKKEVEKIAKKVGGQPGAAGPKGDTGPAGPAGANGDKGAAGQNGSSGTNGAPGSPGASVTGTPIAAGGECGSTTGVKYTLSGTPTKVCNGETGFTATLPPGKTETGTWSIAVPPTEKAFEFQEPISFPIPIAHASHEAFFFTPAQVRNEEFGTTGCKWELEKPNAKPESTFAGALCVFTQYGELASVEANFFQLPGEPAEEGYGPSGTFLYVIKKATVGEFNQVTAVGTWAVTAPTS